MMFSVVLLLTVLFAYISWQHGVGSILPKQDNSRPRRISIAELTGKTTASKSQGHRSEDGEDLRINDPASVNTHDMQKVDNTLGQGQDGKDTSHIKIKVDANDIGVDSASQKVEDINQGGNRDIGSGRKIPNGVPRPKIPSDGGPRIFCMIYTTMTAWRSKGHAVRDTWAQRCHVYKFFYTPHDNEGKRLPAEDAVPLDVPDGREHLTAKTMTGLEWAYTHYSNEVDWFFKADDDTFVIMENLRFVAAQFVPSQPHYIGGRSMDLVKHGYNGGGAGYLLSHETARLLLEEGPKYPKKCKKDGGFEDLDIGICLETLHVYPINTCDSKGRLTFHPDHPAKLWTGEGDSFRVYTYSMGNKTYGNPRGIRTMSPHTVSFHYVPPAFMYMYDFMLYHLVRHHYSESGSQKSNIIENN